MSVKIRLQRYGRKGKAFYPIVVTNVRSSRNGKFIEKLGTYNPNYNPHYIILNIDKSIYWLNKGAIPTKTVKNIFSKKGVFFKKHLLKGVDKLVLDVNKMNEIFNKWCENKMKF